MKKNYEKTEVVIGIIIIFIFMEIILSLIFYTKKYRTYKVITGIVITKNYIKTYADTNTLQKLKSAKCFYIDDKKRFYEIIQIEKNIIKQNSIWYHEVLIKFEIPKKYKDNDSISISINNDKEKMYRIFRKCWESDL